MLETKIQKLSLEDFLKQPETEPYSEYIKGEVIQKPMPQIKHSRIQGKLVTAINSITEVSKTSLAFPELRCTFGNRSIVPDIVILEWQRIPLNESGEVENSFNSYPDWMIEILSPNQNITKVISKIIHCLEYGTRLGWLIDPEEKMIFVFLSGQHPRAFEKTEDVLPVLDSISDFSLTVGDIFGWLRL